MIITAVAVGTRGDVEPLAELGEEMLRRGHEFRILTSEAFRSFIENKGVTFIKLDMDADHVTAWSKGGATDESHCQMLCRHHNRSKGNK